MRPLILCSIGSITWSGSLSQFAASLFYYLCFLFYFFSTCTCIGCISVGKALFLGLHNIALFCSGGMGTCVNARCAEIKMHLLEVEVILFVCGSSSCLDVKLTVSGRREESLFGCV